MKASNPKVMIEAYRLLVARMDALGRDYPLHLGVTEAGNGEDGRIKSAIGIGSLLDDGLGDTIRVSLTEEPEEEVPVAFAIAKPYNDLIAAGLGPAPQASKLKDLRDPYHYVPRPTYEVATGAVKVGGLQPVGVVASVGDPPRWPDGDIFLAVADLAKRKGQNAIRPDIHPRAHLGHGRNPASYCRTAQEERGRGPIGGQVGSRLDSGCGRRLSRRCGPIAPSLHGIGGIKLDAVVGDPVDWDAYEECVKAAIPAQIPLWLQARDFRTS